MKKLLILILSVVIMIPINVKAEMPYDELLDKYTGVVEELTEIQLEDMTEEINVLSKLIWAEARGVRSKEQRAAVVWCVFNRVEDHEFPDDIISVVKQKKQFAYKNYAPVETEHKELAKDVLRRWMIEQHGIEDVGRVLPKSYLYFAGRDKKNFFRELYRGRKRYWNWTAENPYEVE